MSAEIWASFREARVLRTVREELQLLEIISDTLTWRIILKESLCPYHIYRVQALALPNHRAKVVFVSGFAQYVL